jgi:hypothetical protein
MLGVMNFLIKFKFLLITFLLIAGTSFAENYLLKNGTPKYFIDGGYKLHSVVPIEGTNFKQAIYTLTLNNSVVSCVVYLHKAGGNDHKCYHITNIVDKN